MSEEWLGPILTATATALLLKDGRTLLHWIPMLLLAASSVISAIVAWKTHTRITENGIWTGRGFLEWHDVDEWFFKTVGEREVMFLTQGSGFLKHQLLVNVTPAQKAALTETLKQRVPHLEKRPALVANS
jgi:hypothetical protein